MATAAVPRWVAVTTAAAQSQRRTVGAGCGADAERRRFGSLCQSHGQSVADTAVRLGRRQARHSSTPHSDAATADVSRDSLSSALGAANPTGSCCSNPLEHLPSARAMCLHEQDLGWQLRQMAQSEALVAAAARGLRRILVRSS